MTDPAVLQERLTQAEEALHKLRIGEREASVAYDGFQASYTMATMADLQAYIDDLKRQLGLPSTRRRVAPRVIF